MRVDDREIAKKLRGILDLQLRDTVNAREMQPDGIYTRVKPKQGEPPVDSQMAMYGYFQHGFETAHPAAPTRKAAAKPVQKPKRPTPHPHKPENKRFRGFLTACLATKSNPAKAVLHHSRLTAGIPHQPRNDMEPPKVKRLRRT